MFEDTAPVVEGLSIDEAFLDVRGLDHISGTPVEIAARLRRRVRRGGRSADHRRRRPDQVPGQGRERGGQAGRLAGGARPNASSSSCTRCRSRRCGASGGSPPASSTSAGSRPSARWRCWPSASSSSMLGRASGRHLHALANNYDPRPVQSAPPPPVDRRPARARPPPPVARGAGRRADRARRPGRRGGCGRPQRVCRTVVLRMRFEDFSRATRSYTMREATDQTPTILHAANGLLKASMPMIERRGLTLIGIALTNLSDRGAVQLVLPFDRAPRPRRGRRPRAGPVRLEGDHARRAGRPATRGCGCRCCPTRPDRAVARGPT